MEQIKILGILLLVAAHSVSFCQNDTITMSLDEAKAYALEHNKELLNAKEDIALSKEEYKQQKARGLPQLKGTMDYMTNFGYEVEFDFGPSGQASQPQIDQSLLDQGDREVLKVLQQMQQPSGPATITMEDQMNAQARLSQLLFSGQFWVGLETAKIARELAKKQVDKTESDIKQQVSSTFYLILVSEKSLEIINKNISNLEDVLKHTKNMYKAGMLEKTDVDQIRMNVSKLKNRREATRRNINVNYKMFKLQLGIEGNHTLNLEKNFTDVENEIISELLNQNFNVDNNPSYQLMDLQEQIKKKQVKLQKWSYAPTVTGFYSYTEKIMTTEFDLSPQNAAGITLSLPIYTGGRREAKISKAKIQLDKAQRRKSLLKDRLQLKENQLKYDLKSAYSNYQTQKENVEVAKEVYNSIYDKYKQGLVSSLDLTQANSNYLEAESNYFQSLLELVQTKLKLEKLYNEL
jgi:outer membrane protein TolC